MLRRRLSSVELAVVLVIQMRFPRYGPFAYWLTVVVLSVTGTLYTDILTDHLNVPLGFSTCCLRRGTGDRVRHLVLTGADSVDPQHRHPASARRSTGSQCWSPSLSAPLRRLDSRAHGMAARQVGALPAGLISPSRRWRSAQRGLALWLAYILTRPLGANLGDFLALSKSEGGLGLGTACDHHHLSRSDPGDGHLPHCHPQRRDRASRSRTNPSLADPKGNRSGSARRRRVSERRRQRSSPSRTPSHTDVRGGRRAPSRSTTQPGRSATAGSTPSESVGRDSARIEGRRR